MRNRPIQNVDFELVYCACVEKFVTSNLKTALVLELELEPVLNPVSREQDDFLLAIDSSVFHEFGDKMRIASLSQPSPGYPVIVIV